MPDFDKILPVTDVKHQFLELLKQVQEGGGNIMITKNGIPAGVLMSMDEYEGLMETLDIMSNPETLKALRKARKNVEAGSVVPADDVWGKST